MDFGKVSTSRQLDQISFHFPPDDPRTVLQLTSRHPANEIPRIFIGCPIWDKKDWVGKVYPPKTPEKDFLKYYSRQFNTIELNTTFYRIPEIATVKKWRESVTEGFMFCPKVFQEISRFENLHSIPDLTHRFCQAALQFEGHLGISFMQLPPSFEPQHLVILKRFFKLLPKGFPLAVEFRHPGWFLKNHLIAPAFDLLQESGVSTVITDVAGRRDVFHTSLTTRTLVVRWVGNALHPTDLRRTEQWIQKIGQWLADGVTQIFFFVHQPNEVGSLEVIDELVTGLNKNHRLSLKSWNPDLAHPQTELFG